MTRLRRFFAGDGDCLDGDKIVLYEEFAHISRVLRMKAGDRLIVCFNDGRDCECEIESFDKDCVRLKILSVSCCAAENDVGVTLFQGLIKGERMDWCLQKAVELGAYAVVPVETRRCVVKLDAKKAQKKVARWQQISESAAKQSKRMLIPEVKNVMSWREALALAKELDVLLIPYELAKGMKETREILGAIQPGQSIGIFIGPEGGFEEEEVRDAMEAGAKPVTLGKRILRTETAGMTMLSILMFALEKEDE